MTVAELIKQLQQCPPDLDVLAEVYIGGEQAWYDGPVYAARLQPENESVLIAAGDERLA
jgi:hypothetical protein